MYNYQRQHNSSQKHARVRLAPTSRNYSDDRTKPSAEATRFRLTQRIARPAEMKKIKSETRSPETKDLRNVFPDEGSLRKNYTFLLQSNSHRINNIVNSGLSPPKTGRMAALKNHSPQKIKIKTTGLIVDYVQTSVEKSSSRTKYVLSTNKRKMSFQSESRKNPSPKNQASSAEFTDFEQEEIKRYQVYCRGMRRIYEKGDFTNADGYSIVCIGDSIAYRYEVLEQLGQGAFGRVYKCKDHKKNEVVALKVIRSLPKLNKQAKIQIQILESAANEPQSKNNIVKIKGSFIFRGHTCISYELLSLNLYQYLKINRFKPTPEPVLIKFTIQLLHALYFLHSRKVVHCDIKPENMMLKQPHKTGLKLIDLGSSCHEEQQFYTYIQSRFYRAPEIILGIRYTTAIDMWSLGCVLGQLWAGHPLFPGESEEEQLMMHIQLLGSPPVSMLEAGQRRKRFFGDNFECRIVQSPDRFRIPKGTTFQKLLKHNPDRLFVDFLKRCIDWEPSKRITAKQALLHEWILSGMPANIRARHIVEVTGEGLVL